MNDKKLSTVEALLAKAESTTSPEEAEALTAKAEELMIRYGIEAAMLAARRAAGAKPEQIVTRTVPFKGNYGVTLIAGGWLVARAMSGEAVQGYQARGTGLVLIGFESDVEQAARLVSSLALQAMVARDAWWRRAPERKWADAGQSFVERRTFVDRFFVGAADRLRRERAVAVGEARASEPGTELVLRGRSAAVAEHLAGLGLRAGKQRRTRTGYAGAHAGYAAGQSANVGTTGIGGGRRAVGQ